ncbi:protein of unknown function [Rhodovastum atsumiense]|nr:protein of unknown function [Rhodovastum atsumiense]
MIFFRLAKEDLARVSFLSADKVREAQVVREALEITAFGEVARKWDGDDPRFQRANADILACIAAQKEAG